MKKIIFLLFISWCRVINAQNVYVNEKVIIFNITYFNYSFPEHKGDDYCLVNTDSLEAVINRLEKDTSVYNEKMLYNLTKAGAVFISNDFLDIFTKACCEHGNIDNFYNDLGYNDSGVNLKRYTPYKLDSLRAIAEDSIQIKKNRFIYEIKYWSAEINYCLCKLYMESPRQSISAYKGAYIYGESENNRPRRKQRKQVNRIVKKLGYK